ncbi:phage/plasmid replication domain-containing protein [Methylomonas koyamae]|uniref:Replication-associated protein G2P n=1 Tax=Methylomonas koyamae TaxID=702114 RepID=A0AA91I3Q9_9GAMM|nr:phage/plasmid replication protein [Methylomonas koyamae]OAI22728.1 hypothetical protein A1356_18975 [Methylomonas koyamae]
MFFDWLDCYQDYEQDLPIISDDGYCNVDYTAPEDERYSAPRQRRIDHPGSYSTKISVHVVGRRVYISGNPSRYNRLDNLFGLTTIDQCVSVYNAILADLGIPPLVPAKFHGFRTVDRSDGTQTLQPIMTGCHITTLHITENIAVGGAGMVDTYLKALSSQSWRNRRGRLHSNGKAVDWVSNKGHAREIYASVYDKGHEIGLHSLERVRRKFGQHSTEYKYLVDLKNYCDENGVARFELKLNSPYLKRHNLQYYQYSDYSHLEALFKAFINLDQKLEVNHMDLNTITQALMDKKIVESTKSANITALYAINWMNGQTFDLSKRQVKTHRARLRQIGIDIGKPCNLLTFSPVIVKQVTEITKAQLPVPSFYKHPNHLRLVA